MVKKVLIGGAVAAALSVFVFGRDVWSYAKTSATSVRNAVKSEVPLEFEIERARKMVEDLVPDIRQCMHVIAEQQVDIEHMQADLARKQAALKQQKEEILALREDLKSGATQYVYHRRVYTVDDVKRDLASRFEQYKAAEQILERDQQILEARQKALEANQKKLDEMLAAKQNLEVQLAQLDARLKAVRAAEAASELKIDDSQLSRAKTLITELNKQLDVRERLLNAEGKFMGRIPVGQELVPEDIGGEIDTYFQRETSDPTADVVEAAPAL